MVSHLSGGDPEDAAEGIRPSGYRSKADRITPLLPPHGIRFVLEGNNDVHLRTAARSSSTARRSPPSPAGRFAGRRGASPARGHPPTPCPITRRSRGPRWARPSTRRATSSGRVEKNLYWVTDSAYQAAFLTTRDGGRAVRRAPPSIGHKPAARPSTRSPPKNGVSNKVTHLVLLPPPRRPHRRLVAVRDGPGADRAGPGQAVAGQRERPGPAGP